MTTRPESKDLHDRAATSAKETRSTLITLSSAAIGGLFFVATGKIEPALSLLEKVIVLFTILGMVASLGAAVWFSFCDAQWSYWWGVELDEARGPGKIAEARRQKNKWHRWKSRTERATLVFFLFGAVAGGSFVVVRTLISPTTAVTSVKSQAAH